MSYSTEQHYLIKTKDYLSYFFYINEDQKLHYKLFNSSALYMKDELISDDQIIDYSGCIDNLDQIHLLYLDIAGNLKYVVGRNNNWNTKDISKLDIASNNYSYFTIYIQNNYTHLLYIKTNLLNKVISSIEHIFWDKATIVKNKVTTYMPGKYISPFHIDIDSTGSIHMVFKGIYKKNNQLYYSRFNINTKKWSASEILTDPTSDHSHPFILIDKKDNLHLCWCTVVNNNFVLSYKSKERLINVKEKWSEKLTLSDQNSNYISPVIVQHGNKIKILSRQNDTISEIISDNFGTSWNLIKNENYYKCEQPLLVKYHANLSDENEQYKLRYLYVEVSDHIKSLGTEIYLKSKPTTNTIKTAPEQPKPKDLIKDITNDIIPYSKSQDDDNIEEKILSIINDIDNYINDMESHIKKLSEIKSYLNSSKTSDTSKANSNEQEIQYLIKLIKDVESQLQVLEDEKQELIRELNYYNKKVEYFENKLVELKKQYLTLDEIVNKDIVQETSLLDKIINYFK